MYTPAKAIPIPTTSSNTNSLGSSDFDSSVNFLYALGPIISVKKARNDAVSTFCSYKAISSTNNDAHVPPPGNLPNPNRVAS